VRGGANIQTQEEAHEITVDPAESLGLEGTDEESAAASRIQSIQRGKLARKELQEQKAAATKIQAIQRGKQTRRARDGGAAPDAPDADAADEEAAAVRIQAMQRGKLARKELAGMQGSLSVQFVILPENFTYELECPAGATWAQAKAALEADLAIKQENMRIRVDGADVQDDSATLAGDGVTSGMQLELEVVYADGTGAVEPEVFEGEPMLVKVERGDHPPVTVKVYVDKSELKQKAYLGGFRNKKTEVEYHHAFTQTPPDAAMIARAEAAAKKVITERTTQTVVQKSRSVNTVRETATQMNPPYLPLLIDESKDKVLEPRPYFSADQLWQLKAEKTLVIQCHVRGWFARRVAAELRRQLHVQQQFIQEQAAARAKETEENRRREIERRMHPRTAADFEVLHKELEGWRLKETNRIHADANLADEDRQAEIEVLLGKETQLLQTIDRLRIAAAEENKRDSVSSSIEQMAQPKLWALSDGEAITVHTPFTSRAREMKELYKGLEMRGITVDERLDVLLHVKWTVTEFDCPLTRDIVQLIDREADMLNRGRSEKSLSGLRRRLTNLFLHFLMTPEFNPESSRFQKVPPEFTLKTRTMPCRPK
jgi:hypothetical protein